VILGSVADSCDPFIVQLFVGLLVRMALPEPVAMSAKPAIGPTARAQPTQGPCVASSRVIKPMAGMVSPNPRHTIMVMEAATPSRGLAAEASAENRE
jgi:hypothetical protein